MIDEGTAVSVGDALAAARRQSGLTITQISQRTCIRETIIRGIERGDYSACGGDFYARGHVRSIARAVGLDPDEMVREYDSSQARPQPITAADVFQPFTPVRLKERRRPNWTMVLLAGLVVVTGIAGYGYFSNSGSPPARQTASTHRSTHSTKSSSHPAAANSAASPAASPAPVAAATQAQVAVVARPGKVTWAEFTANNGQVLFQGDIGGAAVSTRTVTAAYGMTVRLGNPGGAELYLNGKLQPMTTTQPVTLTCTRNSCS